MTRREEQSESVEGNLQEEEIQPLTNNVDDVALILEGGGMRGSYTAPVVVALLKQQIYFDYVAGISAGVTHLTNYLSRDPARAKEAFTDFAADPNFGGLGHLVQGRGLFNANYIYRETSQPGRALPLDYQTFYANPARTRIGTFRCDTGESIYFTEKDGRDPEELMLQCQASSTVPGVMPTVYIDGVPYVDGAMGESGGIPLDVAKKDGYRKFFIVLSRERDYIKQNTKLNNAAYRVLFKQFPALADALEARADNYNRTRAEIFDLEASGDAYVFVPEWVPVENATMNVSRLKASFGLGMYQVLGEMPKWAEFLGRDLVC